MDGYGNPCDTDVKNDGATGLDDLLAVVNAAATASQDEVYHFHCYGDVSLVDDLAKAIDDAAVYRLPGPSGLACAGTVPCPVP